MLKTARLASSILRPATLLAGSALMWWSGAPLLASATWLVLAGASLAIDPLGPGAVPGGDHCGDPRRGRLIGD